MKAIIALAVLVAVASAATTEMPCNELVPKFTSYLDLTSGMYDRVQVQAKARTSESAQEKYCKAVDEILAAVGGAAGGGGAAETAAASTGPATGDDKRHCPLHKTQSECQAHGLGAQGEFRSCFWCTDEAGENGKCSGEEEAGKQCESKDLSKDDGHFDWAGKHKEGVDAKVAKLNAEIQGLITALNRLEICEQADAAERATTIQFNSMALKSEENIVEVKKKIEADRGVVQSLTKDIAELRSRLSGVPVPGLAGVRYPAFTAPAFESLLKASPEDKLETDEDKEAAMSAAAVATNMLAVLDKEKVIASITSSKLYEALNKLEVIKKEIGAAVQTQSTKGTKNYLETVVIKGGAGLPNDFPLCKTVDCMGDDIKKIADYAGTKGPLGRLNMELEGLWATCNPKDMADRINQAIPPPAAKPVEVTIEVPTSEEPASLEDDLFDF